MGTQVIAKDSGRRLGLVGEIVVDVDRREVVALGLRDNALTRLLPGSPRWMLLTEIRLCAARFQGAYVSTEWLFWWFLLDFLVVGWLSIV